MIINDMIDGKNEIFLLITMFLVDVYYDLLIFLGLLKIESALIGLT